MPPFFPGPRVICFNDGKRANVSSCRMFYVLFEPDREHVMLRLGLVRFKEMELKVSAIIDFNLLSLR